MTIKPTVSSASHLRNFVFGVEDSLVSTVGLLSGIAIAGMEARTILITGSILIFVEAFSMAVGSFLSEYSAEGYLKQAEVPFHHSLLNGSIMFISYLISGLIPVFPYALWSSMIAFWVSMILSLVALFLLGVISAKVSHVHLMKSGLRVLVIGGIAIVGGILMGRMTHGLL